MKKIYAYSAVLATAISLIGCGGGSDNSAPPAGTKSTISIGNNSNSTYVRAVLLDQNGNVFAEQDINCQAAQVNCEFYLKEILNDSEVTLLVLDNQGRMIRAFKALGSQLLYGSVYPSSVSTGFYLTEKLQNNYLVQAGVPQDETYLRLAQFFQNYSSPDNLPEYDEEVGDYYAKQKASNPSLTEAQFLEALMARLSNWDVATAEELPASVYQQQAAIRVLQRLAGLFNDLVAGKVEPISAAYAQTTEAAGCSSELAGFLKVTGSAADAIPIVGGVVSGLFGIAEDSCSTVDAKLDSINSQLTTLTNSVNTVGSTLAQAKALGESEFINKETQKFKDARQTVINQIKARNDFLNANRLDGTTSGPKAQSLEAWFQAMGGYSKGMSSLKTDAARKTLTDILKSMNVVIADMTSLTTDENLKTYYEALNNRCKDITTNSFNAGRNFVATRQSCNNAILANVAYLMGTEGMVMPLAKDVFKVLDKYFKAEGPLVYNEIGYPVTTQSLVDKYPKENLKIEQYEGAYEKTKTIFRVQQSEFLSDIKASIGHDNKGYFNTFSGLPEVLVKRIAEVCGKKQPGQMANTGPAITGWFAPTGVESDRYIVTECYLINNNQNTMSPVKAKYYYALKNASSINSTVINVMGVLADAKALSRADIDDNATDFIFERFTTTETGLVFYAPNLLAYSQSGINNGTYIPSYSFPYTQPNYLYKTNKPSEGYYKALLDSNLSMVPNWLLFKDKDGFHHAVLMALDRATGKIVSLHCRTPDCGVGPGKEWLTFKDSGLNVDVSYMSSHAYVDNMYVYQLGPLK